MITYSRLGKVGRLGNQLFQIAFITAMAERYNVQYYLPYWKYGNAFEYPFNFRDDLDLIEYDHVITEPIVGFDNHRFEPYIQAAANKNINFLTGYFQSYRYFTKAHVMKIFKFKDPMLLKMNINKSVAISVRRGDFVRHPLFNDIRAEEFRRVLEHFTGFKVFVFSDDFNYCKRQFIGPQYEFFDGFNDIQQLQVFSQFRYFVLSNSTFSYWGPMLNPAPRRVYYPEYMFPDLEKCKIFNRDYWPESTAYISYANEINKTSLNAG